MCPPLLTVLCFRERQVLYGSGTHAACPYAPAPRRARMRRAATGRARMRRAATGRARMRRAATGRARMRRAPTRPPPVGHACGVPLRARPPSGMHAACRYDFWGARAACRYDFWGAHAACRYGSGTHAACRYAPALRRARMRRVATIFGARVRRAPTPPPPPQRQGQRFDRERRGPARRVQSAARGSRFPSSSLPAPAAAARVPRFRQG